MTRRPAAYTQADLTRAIALADAGATTHEIAAWTGHQSLSEVDHYTRAADRRRAVTGKEAKG